MGAVMLNLAKLMEQVTEFSASNPSKPVYVWVNHEGSDCWAIDTDRQSNPGEPTFVYMRPAMPQVVVHNFAKRVA